MKTTRTNKKAKTEVGPVKPEPIMCADHGEIGLFYTFTMDGQETHKYCFKCYAEFLGKQGLVNYVNKQV